MSEIASSQSEEQQESGEDMAGKALPKRSWNAEDMGRWVAARFMEEEQSQAEASMQRREKGAQGMQEMQELRIWEGVEREGREQRKSEA